MVLLTPGPCQTSEAVRLAGARDFDHRDPEFASVIAEVRSGLLDTYPGTHDWVAYLIGGSGTAAMEAMAASCVRSGPVLVLVNGHYSARMADIFVAHGIECERIAFGWLDPIRLTSVEDRLRSRAFEAVIVTHHETTTNRLNPVEAVAELAHRFGARCLVDAMSSFGADPLDVTHIDAVCASGNKCLHGMPGVSFVLASPSMAEVMRAIPARTYYLHLPSYEADPLRNTPPVPALLALAQAMREFKKAGGQPARKSLYLGRAARIRAALMDHDLSFVVDQAKASCSSTTCQAPPGATATEFIQANYDRGYLLYGCKGELATSFFQVANMGELTDAEIDGWIETFHLLTSSQ